MKKSLLITTLCILTGIFLSSCGTHMSMTKRHYNKGYYIAHSSDKQLSSKTQEKKAAITKPTQSLYTMHTVTDESTLNGYTPANGKITASIKTPVVPVLHQPAKQILKKRITVREFPAIQQPAAQIKKPAGGGESHHHLSLFWLVILIILILWAVGFLAGGWGLGGLINLLLLIALILLILWLLRIV